MDPIGFLLIAGGLFGICGAICNWDWFFRARKARFMVDAIGRTGARVFYGILGSAIVVAGVMTLMGLIEAKK
jgi:hypothetical protein